MSDGPAQPSMALHSLARHGLASTPLDIQAHQHGGAQIELLGQLCDVDVHRDQVVLV